MSKICPNCGDSCVLKDGMFFLHGKYFTGYVCEPCNALYQNPEDSMFKQEKQRLKKMGFVEAKDIK